MLANIIKQTLNASEEIVKMVIGMQKNEGAKSFENRNFIDKTRRFFSDRLYFEVKRISNLYAVEEIRLRRDRRVYLTVGSGGKKQNFATDIILDADELSKIFERMCDGSLYAYSESIIKGYVSLPSGIRVGVCGRASVENGKIFGVYDISALNIRIPRSDICVAPELLALVKQNIRQGQGVLIFSPPAQGKTTCLRSLAYELACGEPSMRISVIDTRGELSLVPKNASLALDILTGYPKAEGIRIATLFMNPEAIICDEIGGLDEALSIVDAQNCGVPLIASTHGSSISAVMLKNGITALHTVGAFGLYVSLRIGAGGKYEYKLYGREEADAALADNRRSNNIF